MRWEVEYTDEFGRWFEGLSDSAQRRIVAAVEIVEQDGPNAGRPTVDTISGSRHPNMKEIRVGTIRILFAFDPRRVAILLLGGDKRHDWSTWYEQMIPFADRRYDQHLRELRKDGLI